MFVIHITNRTECDSACARTRAMSVVVIVSLLLFFVAFRSVLFGLGFNAMPYNCIQYIHLMNIHSSICLAYRYQCVFNKKHKPNDSQIMRSVNNNFCDCAGCCCTIQFLKTDFLIDIMLITNTSQYKRNAKPKTKRQATALTKHTYWHRIGKNHCTKILPLFLLRLLPFRWRTFFF